MGEEKQELPGPGSVISMSKKKTKQHSAIDPHMSPEEIRLNKQLLKEISRKKKEKLGLIGLSEASIADTSQLLN